MTTRTSRNPKSWDGSLARLYTTTANEKYEHSLKFCNVEIDKKDIIPLPQIADNTHFSLDLGVGARTAFASKDKLKEEERFDYIGEYDTFPDEEPVRVEIYNRFAEDDPEGRQMLVLAKDWERLHEPRSYDLACALQKALGKACEEDAELDEYILTIEYLDEAISKYASLLDRMINYSDLDNRIYSQAEYLNKRLQELSLKWSVASSKVEESFEEHKRQLPLENGAQVFLSEQIILPEEDLDEKKRPFTLWQDLERNFDTAKEQRDKRINDRIEIVLTTSQSLIDEDQRKNERSINMVLYWLGIITLVFGFVTIYDKYLSGDTFGLDSESGLFKTGIILAPMAAIFAFIVIRHGMFSKRLSRWVDWSWVSISNFFHSLPLLKKLRSNWLSRTWTKWFQMGLVNLNENLLPALESHEKTQQQSESQNGQTINESITRQWDALWEDLNAKIQSKAARKKTQVHTGLSAQLRNLHMELLVNLGLDFLWFELRKPILSISIYTHLFLRARTMDKTTLQEMSKKLFDDSNVREYIGRHARNSPQNLSGTLLWQNYKQIVMNLVTQGWDGECPKSDRELWDEIVREKESAPFQTQLDAAIRKLSMKKIASALARLSDTPGETIKAPGRPDQQKLPLREAPKTAELLAD